MGVDKVHMEYCRKATAEAEKATETAGIANNEAVQAFRDACNDLATMFEVGLDRQHETRREAETAVHVALAAASNSAACYANAIRQEIETREVLRTATAMWIDLTEANARRHLESIVE